MFSVNISKSEILCKCCLKTIEENDVRISPNEKARAVFSKLMEFKRLDEIICKDCDDFLLKIDSFQHMLILKHNSVKPAASSLKVESVPLEVDFPKKVESIVGKKLRIPLNLIPKQEAQTTATSKKAEDVISSVTKKKMTSKKSSKQSASAMEFLIPKSLHLSLTNHSVSPSSSSDTLSADEHPSTSSSDFDDIFEMSPTPQLSKCPYCSAISSKEEVMSAHIQEKHSNEQCVKDDKEEHKTEKVGTKQKQLKTMMTTAGKNSKDRPRKVVRFSPPE